MIKYNEVMEHIEVTDDMRSRILQNVGKHFEGKKRAKRRIWFPVLGTVAAAAVLLLVISPWNINTPVTPPDDQNPSAMLGTYGEQAYASASELSAAVGFEIPEITELPFEVREIRYRSIVDYAEVFYVGDNETLIFGMSFGTEDNSGDYTKYPSVNTVSLDNEDITLKADDSGVRLVIWTDGTYAYSLMDDRGLKEEDALQMVREIMK